MADREIELQEAETMKEKIYTIPVTEAFEQDCECPMCLMEEKLEKEAVEYTLGPSMMEPDSRVETNKNGFCHKHFEMLHNLQQNRLALGLVIDTHLVEQNTRIQHLFDQAAPKLMKESQLNFGEALTNKFKNKPSETQKLVQELTELLDRLQVACTICRKLDYTMDKFIDVILYLYFKEPDFQRLFNTKKGFCLKHLKQLLEGTLKYLNAKQQAIFVHNLMTLQLPHMQRIQEEVNWFTKKFDYRYKDEPWHNSKDAIQRSIKKITGPVNLT